MGKKTGENKTKKIATSGQGAAVKQQKMWDEIQAKREANRKQQLRKNLIIGLIAVVVIVAVGLGIWLGMAKKGSLSSNTNTVLTGLTPDKAAQAQKVAKNQGVLIGKGGTWHYAEGVPTVELYFSYACPGCLNLEHLAGKRINQLATEGKINLVYHPVSTHAVKWETPATNAAMVVADQDPEHFIAFHQALMEKGYQIMFANEQTIKDQGNSGDMASVEKSMQIIKQVAKETKVKPEVIDSFQAEQKDYPIREWTEIWAKAARSVAGDQIGTPMFFRNGTAQIDQSKWTDEKSIEQSLLQGQ